MTSATVSGVARANDRLGLPIAGLRRRLAGTREPRNDRDLRVRRERAALNHAVRVAQRELARQRARRPPDHRDRRPSFGRARNDEQLRMRVRAPTTTAREPSVTLSLISGPTGTARARLPSASPPSAASCARDDSGEVLGRVQGQQRRPTRADVVVAAELERDEPAVPERFRVVRARARALPRRGAPPRRSGSRDRSGSATRRTRA